MSFDKIPHEMRQYNSWVLWRLEFDPLKHNKPTKVPYKVDRTGDKANVIMPYSWGSYDIAVQAPFSCKEPVHPDTSVEQSGFSGIGFVFSKGDPFAAIDFDNTDGDNERLEFQKQMFLELNSYTERSPSGTGVHIIVKANLKAGGRRRHAVELYDEARFFTMTGDVFLDVPIREAQIEVDFLFDSLKGDVRQFQAQPDQIEKDEDAIILERANNAANGGKFGDLWAGNWQKYYQSQSEGDFALIDIIAFYTKYPPQIKRLFRQSMLGQRDKAQREDYVDAMIERAFDRQLPPINVEAIAELRDQVFKINAATGANASATEPGRSSEDNPSSTAAATIPADGAQGSDGGLPQQSSTVNPFPAGLLGEVAQFFYDAAPRQAHDIALAGAIGFLSGITGRAYNTETNTGLNQYILMLAGTGIGKDAVSSGRDKLLQSITPLAPTVLDFKGPGELVSSAGIIKWLERKPCVFSILGEFGLSLRAMSAPNANSHLIGLRRTLLQLYSKSGFGNFFDPMAYSDKDKNTASIPAPSLTIFGESVPERFYEVLDENMVMDGLMPRFMVFEYTGKRQYYNEASNKVLPSFQLIQRVHDLAAYCQTLMNGPKVFVVPMTNEARAKMKEFDKWTTDNINATGGSVVIQELWNRSHIKALKLASLQAVGEHYLNPMVTVDHVMWATSLMVQQTNRMIAKFETGMVGNAISTGESKQLSDLMRAFKYFVTEREKYIATYGGTEDMFRDSVILQSSLAKKLGAIASFRNDRMGPTFAIKRAIQQLIDADYVQEMSPQQMSAKYGCKPKAYVIINPAKLNQAIGEK